MSERERQSLISERAHLARRVQELQAELGNPNIRSPTTGKRMSNDEYYAWRKEKLARLTGVHDRLREVNVALFEPNVVLARCYRWIVDAREYLSMTTDSHGVDMREAEQILEAIEKSVPASQLKGNTG